MIIEKDAAGLLAQVIPTLLVFLALEGRLLNPKSASYRFKAVLLYIRTLIELGALVTILLCLTIVMIGPFPSGSFFAGYTSTFIVVSVMLLVCEAAVLVVRFLLKNARTPSGDLR